MREGDRIRIGPSRLAAPCVCLIVLVSSIGTASAGPVRTPDMSAAAFQLADVRAAPRLWTAEEPGKETERDRCKQGARTTAFGWMLVDYGLATAKYLVGLLLVPVGLAVVAVGSVLELADAVACW